MNLEMQQKIQKIHGSVVDFGALIGSGEAIGSIADIHIASGLGMDFEAETFKSMAENIKQGIFNVLFMGEFKNGKSTTINAVIGKEAVPVKATACTGVITMLVYGTNSNRATVFFNDGTASETLNLPDFFKKYQIKPQDEDEIEQKKFVERFKNVSFALIECEHPIMRNGVKIIDSPGLSESVQANNTTSNFFPSANAVVFLLDAHKLFSKEEKNFIREYFHDKQLKNLFFLINRINFLNEPLEKNVIPDVEYRLKPVFTDDKGRFDQELFNRRVFYVNSYDAFKAKEADRPVPIETGIPAFEAELEKFLTSDDRVTAMFQSILTNMANTYKSAAELIDNNEAARLLPLAELEENHKKSMKRLTELEGNVKSIEKTITTTSALVQNKIITDLNYFISTELPKIWDAEIAGNDDIKFGMGEISKIAFEKVKLWKGRDERDARVIEICSPLSNCVESFITEKFNEWGNRVDTLISEEIEDMKNEINEDLGAIHDGLREVKELFSHGVTVAAPGTGDVNIAQLLISILMQDYSMIIEGMAGSQKSWGEFIKKIIVHLVVYSVLASVFTGGLGLIAIIAAEVFQFARGSRGMKDKLLDSIRDTIFVKIQNEVGGKSGEIKSKISISFSELSDKVTSGQRKLISDEKARQMKLMEDRNSRQFDAETERKREQDIKSTLYNLMNTVYFQVYNKPLSEAEVDKIAKAALEDKK